MGKLLLAAICVAVGARVSAGAENPVTWSLAEAPKTVKAGAELKLHLRAEVKPGWHLYALAEPDGGPIPTEISVAGGDALALEPIRAPQPEEKIDPNFNLRVGFYSAKAVFLLALRVDPGAPAGEHTAEVRARYQSCNEKLCLPPRTVSLPFAVMVRK